MLESDFWAQIKRYLDRRDDIEAIRIETGGTINGFPDVLLIRNKITYYVELKISNNHKFRIEPGQLSFARRMSAKIPYCVLAKDKGDDCFKVFTVKGFDNPRLVYSTRILSRAIEHVCDESRIRC